MGSRIPSKRIRIRSSSFVIPYIRIDLRPSVGVFHVRFLNLYSFSFLFCGWILSLSVLFDCESLFLSSSLISIMIDKKIMITVMPFFSNQKRPNNNIFGEYLEQGIMFNPIDELLIISTMSVIINQLNQ